MIQACRYVSTCLKGGLLVLLLLIHPAAGAGFPVLLPTGEPLTFAGNISLLVENVDPQDGRVWIALQGRSGTLKTAIMEVGQRFTYEGDIRIDLTITNVYAGGQGDLVSLMIHDGILAQREVLPPAPHLPPAASPPAPTPRPRSPGFGAAPLLVACTLLILWQKMQ